MHRPLLPRLCSALQTQVEEETAQTLFDQRSGHTRDLSTPASGNRNYGHERAALRRSPPGLRSNRKPHRQGFCPFERDEHPDPLT